MINDTQVLIPGLLDDDEEKLLFELSKCINLDEKNILVEIGPLFGKSTYALCKGLKLNTSYDHKKTLYSFDAFECSINNSLSTQILNLAKKGNVTDLLKYTKRSEFKKNIYVNYNEIFNHYLKSYSDNIKIISTVADNKTIQPPKNKEIALILFNISKIYFEFKPVIFRFLPKTKIGCLVIFADFFNHWSASLMLVVSVLIKKECLIIDDFRSRSLVCKVNKIPNNTDLIDLDLIINNENKYLTLFDDLIDKCRKKNVEKMNNYLPIILLAKMQCLFEKGEYTEARNSMIEYFKDGDFSSKIAKVIDPYLDLMGSGFSVSQMNKIEKK
ncbi:MAG: hypothetical protein CMP38_03885 [Rickettsiales bacterium]|nr:hypothetical protein [Rickettsiales bacterium]OUW02918.1 MAG: hypothetical protein CBD16_03780 [Betaproteobacteria bacterium TMED156]